MEWVVNSAWAAIGVTVMGLAVCGVFGAYIWGGGWVASRITNHHGWSLGVMIGWIVLGLWLVMFLAMLART